MKTTVFALVLAVIALAPAFSDGQFRIGGHAATPVETLPTDSVTEWHEAFMPTDETLSGWYWEVIFNRLGLGMHYGVRFTEPIVAGPDVAEMAMDWKGDFFVSYHVLGGGSIVDPFVEYGWGNVGTLVTSSGSSFDYPDWEDEVANGTAVALGFYSYIAGGVAVDLNGLLLGAKVSYVPSNLATPVTEASIAPYNVTPFEVSLFGGVALGGHRDWRGPRWD